MVSEERRKLGLVLWLLGGLASILFGFNLLDGDHVDCGGKSMQADDTCVTTDYSSGETSRSTQDEQRRSNRGGGYLLISVGGLVVAGTLFGAYRRYRAGQGPSARQLAAAEPGVVRSALASERGWNFQPTGDPSLIAGWRFGPFGRDSTMRQLRETLSGQLDGYRFDVFDFHYYLPAQQLKDRVTCWAVHIPAAETDPLADWFQRGGSRRFPTGPVDRIYAGNGVLCGIGDGNAGRQPGRTIVEGLRQLTTLLAAYRTETSGQPDSGAGKH
jgi:hypothetical protein